MKYIVENWFVIVGLIAVCAAGGYAVYVFVRMPSDKQLNKVREWLLYAVTKAEKELGGGTGQIKLRYVYDMFVARFAWLARVISFEAFSMMVDEALERMKKMIENNKAMQTLVSGEAGETVERICDFATGNAHTIVLIYAIVAVIVWVAVNLYFWKISFDLDREIREEMREYGDCYSDTDEAKFGKHITRLTGFIISIPAAVMWWCTPLIVAGLMIYDKKQEKNPELCGFKADDFDKEENK